MAKKNQTQNNKYEIVLGIVIVVYIIFFSFLSIRRYRTLNSHYYDLGIMNQVVYNTSKGWFLEMTNQQLNKNINRMAIHFDPILAVFAPFYLLYPSPDVLLVGQSAVVGLGGLAVFFLALHMLKKKSAALIFSFAYLLYFPVQRANLFDFHAVTIATTLLLFAFYWHEVRKRALLLSFLFLALFTKEHVGLVVALFGIYLFFQKERKLGAAVFLLGLFFFITTVSFVIPFFRGQTHFALRYFQDFGASPSSVIVNILKQPATTLGYLVREETARYLLGLILPMFYAIFSPATLFISLPEFAINILSQNANMRAIYFHYNALAVPVIVYSAIRGYAFLEKKIKRNTIKKGIFGFFVLANIVSFYFMSPLPLWFLKEPFTLRPVSQKKLTTITRWQQILNNDKIKVATTPILAPLFTNRRFYYNFLYDPSYVTMGYTDEDVYASKKDGYKNADYVIIDRTEIGDLGFETLPVKLYRNFKSDRNYRLIFSDDQGIEVYRKT